MRSLSSGRSSLVNCTTRSSGLSASLYAESPGTRCLSNSANLHSRLRTPQPRASPTFSTRQPIGKHYPRSFNLNIGSYLLVSLCLVRRCDMRCTIVWSRLHFPACSFSRWRTFSQLNSTWRRSPPKSSSWPVCCQTWRLSGTFHAQLMSFGKAR